MDQWVGNVQQKWRAFRGQVELYELGRRVLIVTHA